MALEAEKSGDHYATVLHRGVPSLRLAERAKYVSDIVVATAGLILFAPILLITSVAIKLDSRGPIFVHAPLDRNNNRSIQILKFRVLTACAEGDRINLRVTRVGRILAESGIDELPQLWNVLRGEISIFGRRNVHRWSVSR